MIPEFFQFECPTKIVFGRGLAQNFSQELSQLPVSRLLVVTDPVLRKIGLVDKVVQGLQVEVGGIFDQVPVNSELGAVKAADQMARDTGCDGILAIGGGSAIDTAKAANILLSEGGDLTDYVGAQVLTRPLKPLIVIPTTAGTGSEVTNVAVILDESQHLKIPFNDRFLMPHLAVLDPEMTATMPPLVTAATGMDALTHAIEAYTGLQANPVSDALAYQAVQLIHRHLAEAVKNGQNLDARAGMQVAACLAGLAFAHSMVGVVHSVSHTLGGLFHVPHGVGNAIFLPWGLTYNLDAIQDKLASLAQAFSIPLTGRAAAEAVVERVRGLNQELNALCGLPITLQQAGVPEAELAAVADGAVLDGSSFYNPREVDAEALLPYLQKAY